LVTGPPHIRFYIGQPLFGESGYPVGTLCAIDTRPREPDPIDEALIKSFAEKVQAQLLDRAENLRSQDLSDDQVQAALTTSFGLQITRLSDALAVAAEELQRQRRTADAIARELAESGSVSQALGAHHIAEHRQQLADALGEFEAARRSARVAAFRSLRHEGMSISDIASEWGVSRQLVSRSLGG
jgi:hypothetical protein